MDRQESEILALNSIYGDKVFSVEKQPSSGMFSGCYACHHKLDTPCLLLTKTDEILSTVEVNHLPPIYLYFTLPLDYPDVSVPSYTLACCWLKPSQLIILREKLKSMLSENPGSEILFLWFTFLHDEALGLLEVSSSVDITTVAKESEMFLRKVAHNSELSQSLDISLASAGERMRLCEAFDVEQENIDLLSTPFLCVICLCDRIGRNGAIIKPCRHLFCKSCLKDYFEAKIREGAVQSIICPAEKCETIVPASVICLVVDEKVYQRYDTLLLKMGLDSIGDLVYCPRQYCQYPVIFDKGSSSATCPSCSHAFCIFCRRTYHGVSPCRFGANEIEKLREQYLVADSDEKAKLEQRYGKITIKQAIEEYDSNIFLKDNCRKCPSCSAWCQKIEGCNKMSCTKCRCYFCWLCNKVLNRNDPYAHYSDPETGCSGRLFEGLNLLVNNDSESDDESEDEESDDENGLFEGIIEDA